MNSERKNSLRRLMIDQFIQLEQNYSHLRAEEQERLSHLETKFSEQEETLKFLNADYQRLVTELNHYQSINPYSACFFIFIYLTPVWALIWNCYKGSKKEKK